MAKIIAPFLIKGTLDNLNFVLTADGLNYVRTKRTSFLTKDEFSNNPIYDHIRNHGLEFGQCALKAKVFRQLAAKFNDLAKDGSYAGRVNKILLKILQEDDTQEKGKRTLIAALDNDRSLAQILSGFESNKLRPLSSVLKANYAWNQTTLNFTIENLDILNQLGWPEEATHIHIAIATAVWDYKNDQFSTNYSEELIFAKDSGIQSFNLYTTPILTNNVVLTFLFLGFAKQEHKKHRMLHRKFNTCTIINCK